VLLCLAAAVAGCSASAERDKSRAPPPAAPPGPVPAGAKSADLAAADQALKAQVGELNFSAGFSWLTAGM